MRSVTYLLTPDEGDLDWLDLPPGGVGVVPEAVHAVRSLGDGSVVLHFEVSGDVGRIQQPPSAWSDRLLGYQVADGTDGTLVHLRVHPSGVLQQVLDIHAEFAVVPEFPIDVVDPTVGTVRIVETGNITELRGAIAELREVANVVIEEVRSVDPTSNRLFAGLTDRQQQVLCTAVERGYYDVPREVTYEDIADQLDCSASTVGQHLRRIEADVLSGVAPTKRRAPVQGSPVR